MIPISLTLENFVSHTYSHLDFTEFDVALLIGTHEDNPDKSNGAGKSSIFQSICFALFNKTNYSSKDRVVQRGKSYCSVEFVFELNDGEYKVIRKLDVKSNVMDVSFYRKNNGEWDNTPYTGDTNTITTNNIIKKLGINYDAFVNVVYFKQNDIAGFAAAQTSKRKDILQDILQIGMWNNCQKQAKIEEKRLLTERDSITSRIQGLGNLEEEKQKNQKQIEEAIQSSNQVKIVIDDMEKQLHEFDEEINQLEMILSQSGTTNRRRLQEKLDLIQSRANTNKEKRKNLKDKVQQNNEIIMNNSNEIQKVQFKILELSKDILVVESDARKDIEEMLNKMAKENPRLILDSPVVSYKEDIVRQRENKKQEYQRIVDELKLELKQLLALKPGEKCPTCLTSLDVSIINKKRKEQENNLKTSLSLAQKDLDEIDEIIRQEKQAIKKAKDAYMEVQRYGLILAKLSTSIKEAERYNDDIREKFVSLREEWNYLKEKKKKNTDLLNQTKDLTETQKELEILYKSKKKILSAIENSRKKLMECSIKQGHLEGYKEELERRESEKSTLTSQRDVLSFDVEAYSSLVRIFGRDGIQSIIMENMTEDLRSYTNATLKHLSNDPMSIDLVTQRQTTTGSWKEDFDINILIGSEVYDFDDLSGGEQVRVAFALRLALSKILMRRVGSSIKFLLLDEIDQSLDKHGIDVLVQTINSLTNEFKILVITHNDHMKDKFENVIVVKKGRDGTILKQ